MDSEADFVWMLLFPASIAVILQDPSDAALNARLEDILWEYDLRQRLELEGQTSGLVFWFGEPYLWLDSTTNSVYYLLEAPLDRTDWAVEQFDQRCMRLGHAARRHLDRHGFGSYSVLIVVVPDIAVGFRWLARQGR